MEIFHDGNGNKLWLDKAGSVWFSDGVDKPVMNGAVTREGGVMVYNDVRDLRASNLWGIHELVFKLPVEVLALEDADTKATYAIDSALAVKFGERVKVGNSVFIVTPFKHWKRL